MIPKKVIKDYRINAPAEDILKRDAEEMVAASVASKSYDEVREFIIGNQLFVLGIEHPAATEDGKTWVGDKPFVRVFQCHIDDAITFTVGEVEQPPKNWWKK